MTEKDKEHLNDLIDQTILSKEDIDCLNKVNTNITFSKLIYHTQNQFTIIVQNHRVSQI
jgi:hypothetical protein